ncbi:MAG TPA: lysylphosphatidylglycerol synthase transmembrane domain-containing protein [Tepidisphaeraceae bacterium]|jgi:uncharacterized protein (TIRG00374 family)
MSSRAKKWLLFGVRWGIAVAGIWYVLSTMWFRDHVTAILAPGTPPVEVALAAPAEETSGAFLVVDRHGEQHQVDRQDVINKPTRDKEKMVLADGTPAVILGYDAKRDFAIERVLVGSAAGEAGHWISPSQIKGGRYVQITRPRIEPGVINMVRRANGWLLLAAVVIFPLCYIITAFRWHAFLKALDIHIGQGRTFVLNMVGAFYNSFMPGSTGGDLLKAWYASQHTTHRARAVISVLVDRVIGLLALIILGAIMAAYEYFVIRGDPARAEVARACRKVALGSGLIIAIVIGGLVVFYTPMLRKWTGLDFVLKRLPMQKHVHHAVEAMEIYGRRPWLAVGALVITFPVHMTVVLSAMFAGMAFGLHINPAYYWVCVPVIVLVGAIPISPQGAGVMEVFAIQLTKNQGASVSEAVALTMSIRMVQIFWNLTGGVFVFRGGYHAPSTTEQQEMEADEAEDELLNPAASQAVTEG